MKLGNIVMVLIVAVLFCLIIAPLTACAGEPAKAAKPASAVKPAPGDNVALAQTVLDAILAKKYSEPEKYYDETMKKKLPATYMKGIMENLYKEVGAFKKKGTPKKENVTEAGKTYEAVTIPCQFEKANLNFRVVFDKSNKIAGLFFKPAK